MFWDFLRRFLKGWFFTNRRGYSLRGFWGEIKHYNKDGVQIGYSVKSFWGGRKRYDMSGKLISYTVRNFWGGYNTYDADGNLIRKSYRNFWGGYNTYDRAGKKIIESYQSFWGGMNHFDVEDSNSAETFICEQRNKTREKQNVFIKSVSEINVKSNTISTRKDNVSSVKNEHEQVRAARTQVKEDKEIKGVITSHTDSTCKQHIDKPIPFYESLSELDEEENDDINGVKILVFSYKDLKEFPAYVYGVGEKINVSPLIRNVLPFAVDRSEIPEANKKLVEGLEMDEVDREFMSFCASKMVNEFGDLFPEYEYKSDGLARVQYEFKCGLIITENSWIKLMEVFGE